MHPLAAGSGSNAGATVLGFVIWAVIFAAYWTPTIVGIARRRHIPNVGGVIIINALLGWTVIGWIVALVMAVRSAPRYPYGRPPYPPQYPPQPPYGPYGQG